MFISRLYQGAETSLWRWRAHMGSVRSGWKRDVVCALMRFVPVESENQVILVESYIDDGALQAHWDSAHMAEYSQRVAGMIAGRTRYLCTV